jgi:TIGR03086 family protein
VARFVAASDGFGRRLGLVTEGQWSGPTPCTDWDVRALVNHVAQGNLNYVRLLDGASAAEFLRHRDADALGDDPAGAFAAAARACAEAYAAPGVLERVVDHPSGRLTGAQALAVRTTDTVIHTWDLARAIGAEDTLDPDLLAWIEANLPEIYAGMAETPVSEQTTHRFFAAPSGDLPPDATTQDRLLHLFGRRLAWRP